MATRIKYTETQIKAYYERICFPEHERRYTVSPLNENEQLELLTSIIKHHVVRIPFESLVLHYSWHRVIDTDALHVFRKIVEQPGRGGYCMEVNNLLHTVLLSLGFKCYTAPGRVKIAEGWTGFSHLVNLVTIGGFKYLCDVGFGNNEPLLPIKLEHGCTESQIKPARSKLVYQTIPEHLSDVKMWVLQIQSNDYAEWKDVYCFSESEVMPRDIQSMNFDPWIGRHSPFPKNVVCVRYTVGDDAENDKVNERSISGGNIDGMLWINNDQLKWKRNGELFLETTFRTEDERVHALNKYWGIKLDEADCQAITGSVAAINFKD